MVFRKCNSRSVYSSRWLLACVMFAVFGTLSVPAEGWGQDATARPESKPAVVSQVLPTTAETKALNDKLAKYLTGTKWTGQFTMTGVKGNQTETYEIIKAEKGAVGDNWNLIARIKYGGKDATLPLPPIEIKFAGGTPVITVDRVTFPGFGTFDARVLIRSGQYAGTWAHLGQGGGVGGHLFGTIKKMDENELKQKSERSSRKRLSDEK
jgi:hypothetical protein